MFPEITRVESFKNGNKEHYNNKNELVYEIIFTCPGVYEWVFYKNNKYHSYGNYPARIVYNKNRKTEYYYKDGLKHREEGPAIIEYIDCVKRKEHYYVDNKLHRNDGPAYIIYNLDGKDIQYEQWYRYGKIHCEYGPSTTAMYDKDKVVYYFLNDKNYTKEEYQTIMHDKFSKIIYSSTSFCKDLCNEISTFLV
jgi:hypothetical protein